MWFALAGTLRTHRLTLDDDHAIAERQDFCCAICFQETKLTVDHNHQTGRVRGLLCERCNSGIGALSDSVALLVSAKAYLEHYAFAKG